MPNLWWFLIASIWNYSNSSDRCLTFRTRILKKRTFLLMDYSPKISYQWKKLKDSHQLSHKGITILSLWWFLMKPNYMWRLKQGRLWSYMWLVVGWMTKIWLKVYKWKNIRELWPFLTLWWLVKSPFPYSLQSLQITPLIKNRNLLAKYKNPPWY